MTEFIDDSAGSENIWTSSSDGDIPRVQQLLTEGVSVNAQDESGYSPIHAAVSYGHADLLKFLLSVGANIHLGDIDGDLPIHVCESPAIFEILIAAGADPMAPNGVGETLFDKAVDDENEDLINYLVVKGLGEAPEIRPTFNFEEEEEEEEEEEVEEDENEQVTP